MAVHASPLQLFLFLFEYIGAHICRLFRSPSLTEREDEDVNNKVVVITGAGSGLGKFTAAEMAKRGATVVMGCRNMETGKVAQEEIKKNSGSNRVELYWLDLADMSSIKDFAKVVLKEHPVVDILVNNAGISLNDPQRRFTKDGFEMHMGTNHLGHFLLTNLLLESLNKSSIARVVTVSSTACVMTNLDLDDLMMEKATSLGLGNTMPYNNSKFANALFTKELARRGQVKAYSVCPGLAKTPIFRNYSRGVRTFIDAMNVFYIPVDKAADTILLCSLGKEVAQHSGKYYRFGKQFSSVEKLLKPELAEGLWERSERLVNLTK